MQYNNQDKIQCTTPVPKPAKPVPKGADSAANPVQQPTWTKAMGDHPPAGLQAKLTVNQPGDAYEQEADRVAEQVMHMPATETPGIQEDASLMRKDNGSPQATQSAPPIINQTLNSGGQSLDAGTLAKMEPRFGRDFGDVRVHTGEQAAESTKALNARAYTVGRDVVFGAGQYEPGTTEGQKLLAHELTHVVQQSGTVESGRPEDSILSQTKEELTPTMKTDPTQPFIQRAVVRASPPSPVDAGQMAQFRDLIAQYQALLKSNSLSQEEINEVNQAVSQAEDAIRNAQRVAGAGHTMYAGAGAALAATAVLAADDATVIGIADDVAIPFTLLAAGVLGLAGLIASSSARDIQKSGEAARDAVAGAIRTIGQILLAQKIGEQVRGLTGQVVIHLARILGTTVGGQPPDHQQDPKRDRPHWWKEIKNWIQQIMDKGLTPKQLLRELGKRFTPEQLAEIREAIRRAAQMMGEDPPDFPPTATP